MKLPPAHCWRRAHPASRRQRAGLAHRRLCTPTSIELRTLSGTVFGDVLPLAAASVTIMNGIHAGLSRNTDNNASLSFVGLAPPALGAS